MKTFFGFFVILVLVQVGFSMKTDTDSDDEEIFGDGIHHGGEIKHHGSLDVDEVTRRV